MFAFVEKYKFMPYSNAKTRANSNRLIKRLVIHSHVNWSNLTELKGSRDCEYSIKVPDRSTGVDNENCLI